MGVQQVGVVVSFGVAIGDLVTPVKWMGLMIQVTRVRWVRVS